MSYLEMKEAPVDDADQMIISVWFRDARKNPAPAPQDWPAGLWTSDTAHKTMVPPNTAEMIKDEFKHNVFYWNAYGMPIQSKLVALPLTYGPGAMMPSPPPIVTNDMHMLLTFGSATQTYNYCFWKPDYPSVIQAVLYVPMLITGPQWVPKAQPPPYAPWIEAYGKFTVTNMLLEPPTPQDKFVPQSFIGVDEDGHLVICLQTSTRADKSLNPIYKGYAFQQSKTTEIRATMSWLDVLPPPTLEHLRDGHWVKTPGYWDGYEFEYEDISNEVMGAQPELFVIGGKPGAFEFASLPPVNDGGWHHLLFSFDISGTAQVSLPSPEFDIDGNQIAPAPPAFVKTTCKAWLALDDVNYTGAELQGRFPYPDGVQAQLPLLDGMGHDLIPFGPVTCATRATMGLGRNEIMPRNCWMRPVRGNPKDGLRRFASTAGTWNAPSNIYIEHGDYNWFVWTGSIWPLFGGGPGDEWRGALDPPRPSTPDPKTFDPPTYFCSGFKIPLKGNLIGTPASNYHIDHNTGIEMAELQIWVNKSIDTGVLKTRRLFIDYPKNEKGLPDTSKPLQPVRPSVAEQVLGKPDVMLHGTNNWKRGKNSGRSGIMLDKDGNAVPNPDGQFIPVARIEKFLPDPKLGV